MINELATHKPSLDYDGNLSKYLGIQHAAFYDQYVYSITDKMTDEYNGGSWDMVEFEVSADEDSEEKLKGFYLRLDDDKQFKVDISTNFFSGEMSAEALSIVANIVALNSLLWKDPNNAELYELYHAARNLGIEHKENRAIIGAID